jgi:hypothetical protein
MIPVVERNITEIPKKDTTKLFFKMMLSKDNAKMKTERIRNGMMKTSIERKKTSDMFSLKTLPADMFPLG